jgi:hypothetical protein
MLGYGGRSSQKKNKQQALSSAATSKLETLVAMGGEIPLSTIPADFDESLAYEQNQRNPAGKAQTAASGCANYGFWASGFGEFISQDDQHKNPEIHDTAAGAVLGFNYYGTQNGIFCASAAYIHNDINEDHQAGSGDSNGFSLGIYGTGYIGNGYIEGGFMFGWSQFSMQRHIVVTGPAPFNETASSSFGNWQYMPHIGGGYDWMMKWGIVEPFASFDWAGSSQESYTEMGARPLNMHVKAQTPSILRSQVGVNVYETWDRPCSVCIFEQTVSYVNKIPFNTNVNAAIVLAPTAIPGGVPGSFGVWSYDQVLNLAGIGAEIFYKHKRSGFFVSATYQGEFGMSYISNDIVGTLGVFF